VLTDLFHGISCALTTVVEFKTGIGRCIPGDPQAVEVEDLFDRSEQMHRTVQLHRTYNIASLDIIFGVAVVFVREQFGQVVVRNLLDERVFWRDENIFQQTWLGRRDVGEPARRAV
jgi:hypothetical protein